MRTKNTDIHVSIEQEELCSVAKALAELEWLLLILLLRYLVASPVGVLARFALQVALFFYGAFILAFHYAIF